MHVKISFSAPEISKEKCILSLFFLYISLHDFCNTASLHHIAEMAMNKQAEVSKT